MFGRYELLRLIGHGGMAEVHVARLGEGATGKLLALKRLKPQHSARANVVKRLIAEAQLTVWLHHPNIVQLFDFGRVDGQYYIAMELVDGCDLKRVIHPPNHRARQLPMEVAVDIAVQLADALRYAHRCTDADGRALGIIHRDVSPQNVLVSRDGHAKLTDFGVARVALTDGLSTPGMVIGKLAYMPPEQARGRDYDQRVDLYALGATLYEMLTASKPFEQSSRVDARRERTPPPPSSVRPSIPASLDALVMRSMAPRADDRYDDASELAEALHRELQALGGAPKPHQLGALVGEAIDEPRASGWLAASTGRLTLRDYRPEDDSLIPREVTAAQRLARSIEGDTARVSRAPSRALAPPSEGAPMMPAPRVEAAPPPPSQGGSVADARSAPGEPAVAKLSLAGWSLLLAVLGAVALGFVLGRFSGPSRSGAADGALRPAPSPQRVAYRALPDVRAPTTVRPPPPAPPPERSPAASTADAALPADAALAAGDVATDARAGSAPSANRLAERERPPRARRRTRRRVPAALTAPPVSQSDAQRILKAARSAYVNAHYRRAVRLGQRVLHARPNDQQAWQVIGASACMLGKPRLARAALDRLSAGARNLIRSVCSRADTSL